MSLADYLAKNYLTADSKPQKKAKKRKRKGIEDDTAGLTIADDDASWGGRSKAAAQDGDDNDDDNTPHVTGRSSEFRKKKTSGWSRVGAPAPKDAEQVEADRIIAETLRENQERQEDVDDGPVIEGDAADVKAMEGYTDSGTKAGLQSSKDVQAAAEQMKREERRRMKEAMEEAGMGGTDGTIYRDASGRIINVAMKRAEARRKEQEEEQKKRDAAEAAKGDAQRVMKEERAQKLKDAKYMSFARRADDEELNEEMRETERWNDPAAQFVASTKKKKTKTGKPLYQGSFAPNRFGIRPGYRWDGVDRGIGFEKRWFDARNKKKDAEALQYHWQMDE
jgi:pre-mRNA-splicing factor CWC26